MSHFIQAAAGELIRNSRGNYRLQFAAPNLMRAGDQLAVLLGSDVGSPAVHVPIPNVEWDFDEVQSTASGVTMRLLRRVVTDREPLLYTFDASEAVSFGYPRSAAAMAAAVGGGVWSAGWGFDIASGNDTGLFGGVTMTASGSPTYGHPGPRGGFDLAVGFDGGSSDGFLGGNNFDAGSGDDLNLAGVITLTADLPNGTSDFIVNKNGAAGWLLYFERTSSSDASLTFFVNDGVDQFWLKAFAPGGVLPIGVPIAWMVVLERATNRVRLAFRTLDGGVTVVSSEYNVSTIGSLSNANGFNVGTDQDVSWRLSSLFVGKGVNAASGMSANLAARIEAFANAIGSTRIFLGGASVYRGLAAASVVDFDVVDRAAVSNVLMPVTTRSRASDVHVGALYENNNGAAVPEPNISATSHQGRKRFSSTWTEESVIKRRMFVYDALGAANVGNISHQVVPGGTIAKIACASLTLPGVPEQGARHVFVPIAMGALGLPVKGI